MDDHQDVATPTSVPTTESNPADPGGADQQDQGRMQQDPTPTPIPADPGGGDMGGISREFAHGPLSTHRVESGPFFLVLAHVVELIVFTPIQPLKS